MTEQGAERVRALTLFGIGCVIGAILTGIWLKRAVGEELKAERETVYDTLYIEKPKARDSMVTGFITAKLPRHRDTDLGDPGRLVEGDTSHQETKLLRHLGEGLRSVDEDSVEVEIPITQKEYGDSSYRAWVSGYMANLDSIEIYRRTEIIRETVQRRVAKRWGFTIGPTVGAGWNGQRISPYVGIGLTWGFCF